MAGLLAALMLVGVPAAFAHEPAPPAAETETTVPWFARETRPAAFSPEPQNEIAPRVAPFSEAPAVEGYLESGPPPLHPIEPPAEKPRSLPWVVPYQTHFTLGWTDGDGDRLGMADLDLREIFAFPKYRKFVVTPGITLSTLDGPNRTDLPGTLYTTWVEGLWMHEFNERWKFHLAASPGLYTDFDNTGSDAFRITGRALAFWQMNDDLQLTFGAVYLDREDIVALPAAGLVWSPTFRGIWDWKFEAIFPRPRIAVRLPTDGGPGELWHYVAGEIGGGSWAIERTDGRDDVVTYSALKLLVGQEWKHIESKRTYRIEGGYLFDRDVEYRSNVGNFRPNDTWMVRVGGNF